MQSKRINKYLTNSINISGYDKYAAIIGLNPSRGARSPLLWNAAFYSQGINTVMIPMDVESKNLRELLAELEDDECYIGGAIAAPYKELVAKYLNQNLTHKASSIGSVNCIYRNNDKLHGTNTDGDGAKNAFETVYGSIKEKNILLLGPGGAGKAIASVFSSEVGSNGLITIAYRSEQGKKFSDKIGARGITWKEIENNISQVDIIINCTTVGARNNEKKSPLELKVLSKLTNNSIVYDIIYDPRETKLLKISSKLGLRTINGLAMNVEQAIIAYGLTAPEPLGKSVTRDAMWNISNIQK